MNIGLCYFLAFEAVADSLLLRAGIVPASTGTLLKMLESHILTSVYEPASRLPMANEMYSSLCKTKVLSEVSPIKEYVLRKMVQKAI